MQRKQFIPMLAIAMLLVLQAPAQIYYKDVLTAKQTSDQLKLYKSNKTKKVILNSFESTGEPTDKFICYQEIAPGFNFIKTFTQSIQTLQSVLVSQFNAKGQLIRSSDSSNTTLNVTTYSYNAQGRLLVAESFSQAYAYQTKETEKHLWSYDSTGIPQKVLRIKNSSDTTVIEFKPDEKGNPGEEIWFSKGKETQHWYYYYGNNMQLTDIVRFNEKARKLLPDYLFEYNDQFQLSQMIAVQAGSSNYVIWRYQYNTQGLKTRENIYSKQKELMGYITYTYQ